MSSASEGPKQPSSITGNTSKQFKAMAPNVLPLSPQFPQGTWKHVESTRSLGLRTRQAGEMEEGQVSEIGQHRSEWMKAHFSSTWNLPCLIPDFTGINTELSTWWVNCIDYPTRDEPWRLEPGWCQQNRCHIWWLAPVFVVDKTAMQCACENQSLCTSGWITRKQTLLDTHCKNSVTTFLAT